jgi:2,4-dienoyl-CoA reductase-like NADH-dependent reductase (Old Yellow Enzyme family)
MAKFERFNFGTLDDLRGKIVETGAEIRISTDFTPLSRPVQIGHKKTPNALAILPMEGCDSNPDGSPSELVLRRYRRLAEGGAGLIWYEACAVIDAGKANPLQMALNKGNVRQFADMLRACNRTAREKNGHTPVSILQLTHSGRYSRPADKAAPVIAQHDPLLDPRVGIDGDYPLVTDDELNALQQAYVDTALLAREAGFDGVDVKACHRYLISELLASHTRPGRFGGGFENRSRFLLDVIRRIKEAAGNNFIVACRFNVFDAHPYPYGFGVSKEDCWVSDLAEPLELVRRMVSAGVGLLSNSAGNPYYRFPQVTRPFDAPILGGEIPDEHPLESVARLFEFTRQIQKAAGAIPVVGNGYSWLRQFLPHAGAANLADGSASFIGLGREAFAYPDAPYDILNHGHMDASKCCIACSKCTQIMRDHGRTGCVIRDGGVYLPLYNQARAGASGG